MKRFWSTRWILLAGVSAAFVGAAVVGAARSSADMATAATRFLDSLTPEQRKQASFAFESDERLRWHFIPPAAFSRGGLAIKSMSPAQRQQAHDLLKTGLSQRGYLTASGIMALETILGALEAEQRAAEGSLAPGIARDPELYFFSVFGTPSTHGTWGWRTEGHHVSLHFTVVNGTLVASAPSFFGSNPAEVRNGPKKGLRLLGPEEDAARALLASLDASQRKAAVISASAPDEILTMTQIQVKPLSPSGIMAGALLPNQRDLLRRLIDVYTGMMASEQAADRMQRLRAAGIEKIGFAWAGSAERGQRHYYRLQGPTFLVEYDNTQNDANHIHSVWRDFDGDFGRDLLREHLTATPH